MALPFHFKKFYFFLSYITFPPLLTIDSVCLPSPDVAFPKNQMIEEVLFVFYSWAPSPKIYYSLALVLAVVQKQLSSVFYDLPHLSGYDSLLFPPASTCPLKIWTVTFSSITASAISGRFACFLLPCQC